MYCIITTIFHSISILLAADNSKERFPLAPLQPDYTGVLVVEELC